MKVGADGVTLGAWADITNAKKMLDIGCGSGLIALMVAQRSNAEITAIDIDNQSVIQSTINVENSPWKERIKIRQISLQDFAECAFEKFDVIISNPPFFRNSLKNPSQGRTVARHADTLPHEQLLICSKKLLNPGGRLCIILPIAEGEDCVKTGKEAGLFCSRKVNVFPNTVKQPKRLLLEFVMTETACRKSNLTIETEIRNQYTPEYTELVKDFYLKL